MDTAVLPPLPPPPTAQAAPGPPCPRCGTPGGRTVTVVYLFGPASETHPAATVRHYGCDRCRYGWAVREHETRRAHAAAGL